jgi:DNA polymerase-3 subunit epsilon
MRQIVLDTETTGLATSQGHRIIEIGCLELVNRRLTGREYHRFLNPEREIDEGAERVHGISIADLEGQPRFADIADELIDFLRDSELVIHNAEFDVGFLDYELQLMKHPRPSITEHTTVLDTLGLARKLHPGQRNSLDALCKRYSVDASRREVHGALIDQSLSRDDWWTDRIVTRRRTGGRFANSKRDRKAWPALGPGIEDCHGECGRNGSA